jgi:hypothetical protein
VQILQNRLFIVEEALVSDLAAPLKDGTVSARILK